MKRAIGIIRVSERHGRDGDRFHSPEVQRERIERDCERWGLELRMVYEELDVSGGKPIDRRPGLSAALAFVENGEAEAIVFAYRDRVDRSIDTGSELCRRMDAAGALLIADGKQITHATHDGWRHATLESFLNEDQRRAIGAKMRDVHRRCQDKGIATHVLPFGYRRRDDGVAEPDPDTAPLAVRAFEMRADGATTEEIREFLREHGHDMTANPIVRMFWKRWYLGELHRKGQKPNLHAHEPIITPELFERVQATRGLRRGRYAKSEYLLARQGILVCATCGGRMSATPREKGRTGAYYRCYNTRCPARPTIDYKLIEDLVRAQVSEWTAGMTGNGSAAREVTEAKAALEAAESALERVTRRLLAAGLEDEPVALRAAQEAREARDAAQAAYNSALARDDAYRLAAKDAFTHGTLEEQRELIRAVVARVEVAKGSGTERVTIIPR